MKNQHTPGNWSCQKSETSRPESVRLDIVTDAGEYSPAFIAGDALPADAALIAAAPDLLSALQEMMSVFQDHEQYDEESAEVVSIARAAIAKAEGRAK